MTGGVVENPGSGRRDDTDLFAVELALLDLDGTVVDTNYQHALAWYRAFRDNGLVLPIWRASSRARNGWRQPRRARGRSRGRTNDR